MSGHTYIHTHIHTHTHTYTHTHDNYYNPRCAVAHRGLIQRLCTEVYISLDRRGPYIPPNFSFSLFSLFSFISGGVPMDYLVSRGFNLDQWPSELEQDLRALDSGTIANVRQLLFQEAEKCGLTDEGCVLVQRKKTTGGKSIRQKHEADLVVLVRSIQNRNPLPRTVLRNGKRSAREWQASQTRMMNSDTTLQSVTEPDVSVSQSYLGTSFDTSSQQSSLVTAPVEDKIFRSAVVRDIGSLRTSVDSLKLELQELKSSLSKCKCEGLHSDLDTCLLYIRLKNWSDEAPNEALLKSKLNSNILAYDVIRLKPTPAFRVKIRKSTLYHALSHARENGCVVDLWRGTKSRWSPPTSHPQFSKNSQSQGSVTVSAWNCRGLATATPYLHRLLEGGSDIVILSEHWLWPFDLYKLDELHPSFSGFCHADSRLSETAHDKSRGCGGVGIFWKKSLDVFPISAVDSDRICGIRLKKDDETWLSIIGAYLPCADLGGDYYRDTLVELESVISGSANLGPVVIAGDFNAHLSHMWGPRAPDTANSQGVLLGELLNRCDLYAASLSNTACGPEYTFHSGDRFTTIDYILTDVEASSCIDHCWTHDDEDLNQSDHLPLSIKLSCGVATQQAQDQNWIRIDWAEAGKGAALALYQEALKDRLSPFIGKPCCDIEQLDDEIKHIAALIKEAAESLLPHCEAKKASRFKDSTLSKLCVTSKVAWEAWKDGGRPNVGPLHEAKCLACNEVRRRIKVCAAMKERKRVQRREYLFRKNANSRFKLPQKRKKSQCTRLRVGGKLISDPTQLLEAWTSHFQDLAQSQIHMHEGLQELQLELASLASESYQKEEPFLDIPFTADEVKCILQKKLKLRKSSGPDDLTTEHLWYGGPSVILWLTEILNSIVELERVPSSLKLGITIPVYKGGGKDPLDVNSYRGITLNSVISKLLESLILNRLEPLFSDAGLPHPNQSAYRKGVSCTDAIFATQEMINRYMQEGCNVFMCLYDLQKAFDSVEIPVLLHRLFEAGVNSKTWRLLQDWYTNCSSNVRVGCHNSSSFHLYRGVRQGSVLSPSLFLLVMDPLLRQLQSHSLGISVNNNFAGSYLHADDIRTLANSLSSMEAQIDMVSSFTSENFLKLNKAKCEVIVCRKSSSSALSSNCRNNDGNTGCSFPVREEVKCLGYLWRPNLSSIRMIEERVQRARRAFFQFGSISAFQGDLSPISSSS